MDLGVQIAVKQKDESLARNRLVLLKEVEKESFYQHRLSHVELSFGHVPSALAAAKRAVEIESKPTFEMLGQLAWCEMRSGKLKEALSLVGRLEGSFKKRPEFILTLKTEIELERKHFSNALLLSEKYPDKNDRFYKELRRRALDGELRNGVMPDAKRALYEKELQKLNVTGTSTGTSIIESYIDTIS